MHEHLLLPFGFFPTHLLLDLVVRNDLAAEVGAILIRPGIRISAASERMIAVARAASRSWGRGLGRGVARSSYRHCVSEIRFHCVVCGKIA